MAGGVSQRRGCRGRAGAEGCRCTAVPGSPCRGKRGDAAAGLRGGSAGSGSPGPPLSAEGLSYHRVAVAGRAPAPPPPRTPAGTRAQRGPIAAPGNPHPREGGGAAFPPGPLTPPAAERGRLASQGAAGGEGVFPLDKARIPVASRTGSAFSKPPRSRRCNPPPRWHPAAPRDAAARRDKGVAACAVSPPSSRFTVFLLSAKPGGGKRREILPQASCRPLSRGAWGWGPDLPPAPDVSSSLLARLPSQKISTMQVVAAAGPS